MLSSRQRVISHCCEFAKSWKRRQYSASRANYALFSLALAGPALLSRPYWQALRDEHVPGSAKSVLSSY